MAAFGTSGLLGLATEFQEMAASAPTRAYGVARTYGAVLRALVRERVSGFPVRVVTDTYRPSIRDEPFHQGMRVGAAVGTDEPRGYRLELGGHGIDSRGREWNQDPRGHFGPSLDEITPDFEAAILGIIR